MRQKRISEETGDEVDYDEIVKGYEIAKGNYVTLEPDDSEALGPKHADDRLGGFVDLDQIDPIYFDRPYYLEPDTGGEKAYRLLVQALGKSRKVGIGRFVMRTSSTSPPCGPIGGARRRDHALPDEIVDTDELDLPRNTKVSDRGYEPPSNSSTP